MAWVAWAGWLCMAGAPAVAASFDCLIEPRRTIEVKGSVEALITAIRVERGDIVRRGDVLVEFESGLERTATELTRYRADMTSAVVAREARSTYATLKHKRRLELTQENFGSRQELDEADAERRLAAAELLEARDNQRLAQLEHQRAIEALRLRRLVSPIAGIVVERLMHPGEVSELTGKSILRLAEIDTLHVEVILPVLAYRQVAVGDSVTVRPEAPIGGELQARVAVVDSVFDAASGTFRVRAELPNPGRRLPAGLRCSVEFPKVSGGGVGSPGSGGSGLRPATVKP